MKEKDENIIITNMRAQCLHNPVGLQEPNPVLSYMLKAESLAESEKNNIHSCQSRYRILAASKKEFLYEDNGDLWDSGIIGQQETFGIVYKGKRFIGK